MFKSSKPKLEPPPPAPPTIQQIAEDLETFHVERPLLTPVRTLDPAKSNDLKEWWKMFETFVNDLQELKKIKEDLNDCHGKLNETRIELETKAKSMQHEIDEHLEQTRNLFNKND